MFSGRFCSFCYKLSGWNRVFTFFPILLILNTVGIDLFFKWAYTGKRGVSQKLWLSDYNNTHEVKQQQRNNKGTKSVLK